LCCHRRFISGMCLFSYFFKFFLFVSRVLRDTLVHLRYTVISICPVHRFLFMSENKNKNWERCFISAFFDWRSVFHALYTMHNTISLILLNRFEDPWWWRRRCSSFWSLLCSSQISPSSKPTYSVSLKRNPAWKGYNPNWHHLRNVKSRGNWIESNFWHRHLWKTARTP